MSNIPIFLSSDNNYAPFVATTIASICDNTKSFIDFYVLDGGISVENKKKIEQLKDKFYNFSIEFIKINTEKEFANIKYYNAENYISISTYNRFLIPKLTKLDKVIYMDVDIVVMGDIAELYNEDLGDYALGAVWDESRKDYELTTKDLVELSDDYKYFNAGVLLMSCKKWREDNIVQKLFDIDAKYKERILHADETLLNKYFDGNYKVLDIKYNYLDYDYVNYNNNNIVIRHFATKNKPWHIKTGTKTELIKSIDDFWHYAKMTPFFKELDEKCSNKEEQEKMLRMLRLEDIMDKAYKNKEVCVK